VAGGPRDLAARSGATPLTWADAVGSGGTTESNPVCYRARTVGMVRWIVDGMNVIGSRPDGWWKDRRRAMVGLVDQLERWVSADGDDVTVVFERPPSPAIHSSLIEIAHAPRAAANSGDDEIVRLVRADARPQEIRVVTSDSTLTDRVRDAGASTYPAERFRNLIDPLR